MWGQIKQTISDSYRAVYSKLDEHRRANSFELLGYDFMIDSDFKIYLIECNTNPCLETGCPLLARIIMSVIDATLRVAVDPLF